MGWVVIYSSLCFQNYVPKVSASEKYRSYLSLMPEDVEAGDEEEVAKQSQILSEFKALSYEEQMNQRLQYVRFTPRCFRNGVDVKNVPIDLGGPKIWSGRSTRSRR